MSLPLELIKSADWQQDLLGWAKENPEIAGAVLGGGTGAGLGGMLAGGKGALAGLLGGAGLGAWGGNAMRPEAATAAIPTPPQSDGPGFSEQVQLARLSNQAGQRPTSQHQAGLKSALGTSWWEPVAGAAAGGATGNALSTLLQRATRFGPSRGAGTLLGSILGAVAAPAYRYGVGASNYADTGITNR